MCTLTTLYQCATLHSTCERVSEERFERGFTNGAKEEDLGLDAQDLAPARSAHPPASIHGSRTVRPTTN
jgi:hypothetical protein